MRKSTHATRLASQVPWLDNVLKNVKSLASPQSFSKRLSNRLPKVLCLATLCSTLLMVGCASDGGSGPSASRSGGVSKIQACRSGDQAVASPSQCLKDEAACYQIANGGWCTGARGNTCPTGSQAVPAGGTCPTSTRCFAISESLNCAIITQ